MKPKPDRETYYENTLRIPVADAVLLKEIAHEHRRNLSQELMVCVHEYVERYRKELKANGAEALRAAGLKA
jgi:hypothetical protein